MSLINSKMVEWGGQNLGYNCNCKENKSAYTTPAIN